MEKNDQKKVLPLKIIHDDSDERYLFVKFERPIGNLAVGNGNSIQVDKNEYLFIQYKIVKKLINEEICSVI